MHTVMKFSEEIYIGETERVNTIVARFFVCQVGSFCISYSPLNSQQVNDAITALWWLEGYSLYGLNVSVNKKVPVDI